MAAQRTSAATALVELTEAETEVLQDGVRRLFGDTSYRFPGGTEALHKLENAQAQLRAKAAIQSEIAELRARLKELESEVAAEAATATTKETL